MTDRQQKQEKKRLKKTDRTGDGLKSRAEGGRGERQRDKYAHEGEFLLQISRSCNLIL